MNPKLIIGLLVLAVLTVIPTIVDGQRRFRWGQDTETLDFVKKLNGIPKKFGDWECTSESELSPTSLQLLTPFNSITRTYFNQREKINVNLFVLLGPTGPTAVHTPDICFDSREYKKIGNRKAISVDMDSNSGEKSDSKFFRTEFKSRNIEEQGLKSIYGWRTSDGPWLAAEQPRWSFADNRYLFKLQATARFPSVETMKDSRVLENFVAEVERNLEQTVFRSSPNP
ncbi:MAG: EpsI family protein [Mariniblastus sp.]|nr:EpsI family protein [Mariniblastus sp.]